MVYKIQPYSYRRAKEIGVTIAPSVRAGKKIDVFTESGDYITSVGDIMYGDFPTFRETVGEIFANERRRLYKIRHAKTRRIVESPSWYADQILW
jgi:hypothetical protein